MRRFTICSFVGEQLDEGVEFDSRHWPLHITIIGNFFCNDAQALESKISSTLRKLKTFTVKIDTDEYFGEDNNILVSTVAYSKNIVELHNNLISAAQGVGATFSNPNFVAEGFRPHVTVQNESRVFKGDEIAVQGLSLVELEKDGIKHQRTVLKNFKLLDGEL